MSQPHNPSSGERSNDMASTDTNAAPSATQAEAPTANESPMETVSKELLIEEVSIDGMCGVY